MPSKLQLLPPDIEGKLQKLPEEVSRFEGLVALWLFGSFARGKATPISDVDLAYLPDENLTGEELERFDTELYLAISHTLTTDEFTLVNLRQAPTYFAWQVLAEGKLLFCRDEVQISALAERVYLTAPEVVRLRQTGNMEFLEAVLMHERSIDFHRVTEFLRLISEDVRDLEARKDVPEQVYIESREIQAVVERRLQTAIESCINIGNHVVARLGLRAPKDYADVFIILAEAQVLPNDLAQRMMDMARFRNLLVHLYWGIDHKRVYESLPQRIEILKAFVKRIAEWMKEQGVTNS
ncbi:Uncharacterized conserved protein YutE, UPF0331/DUF86 family [Candidatus Fervidibacteria bacterium JGI MDM2 JNZ-1-D12]